MSQKVIESKDLFNEAKLALARNELSLTEKLLEQYIAGQRAEAEAFYLLGLCYSRLGKFKKSFAMLERCLELDPHYTEASIALSGIYNDLGQYSKGAKVFSEAREKIKNYAPGKDPKINQSLAQRHFEMGRTYFRYERFDEALTEFEKALSLHPGYTDAVIQLSRCFSRLKQKAEAISLLLSYLKSDPNNVELKVELGILLYSEGKKTEAYQEWMLVTQMDPHHPRALLYLSMLEYEEGKQGVLP